MSVCMRSAQPVPRRLFAASRTSTPITSLPRSRISNPGRIPTNARYNSGKAEARVENGVKVKKGWTSFSVLALMGVSAVAAGAIASWQGKEKSGKLRDYSSPDKFVQPKYASIRDMEAVSDFLHFSSNSIHFSEMRKPDS